MLLGMRSQFRLVSNPQNRYVDWNVDFDEEPSFERLRVYEEHAKSIVSSNASPDIPFNYSINPYRGCFHGCTYCYARPTHSYIDFGAGSDFESKLVVKINAPALLKEKFLQKSWSGEPIMFSGVTDCYQPLESEYELTRECLKLCSVCRNPVVIVTKGSLIRRDIEILNEIHTHAGVQVYISLAFANDKTAAQLEPYAPRPSARLRLIQELVNGGLPVGIALAPIIPGLNDHEIPEILTKAYSAGARYAFMSLLRLPLEVKDVFLESLHRAFPNRSKKIINQLIEMKGGALNRSEFGDRFKGVGERWDATLWLFRSTCENLGINGTGQPPALSSASFRRPTNQISLWENLS